MSNWSATPDAFPLGLAKLSQDTGWKYVAHNRYWSTANVCKMVTLSRCHNPSLANPESITIADAKQNGGDFEFIIEKGGKAIPTTQRFWDYLMRVSKEWGMAVYEQDCETHLCSPHEQHRCRISIEAGLVSAATHVRAFSLSLRSLRSAEAVRV